MRTFSLPQILRRSTARRGSCRPPCRPRCRSEFRADSSAGIGQAASGRLERRAPTRARLWRSRRCRGGAGSAPRNRGRSPTRNRSGTSRSDVVSGTSRSRRSRLSRRVAIRRRAGLSGRGARPGGTPACVRCRTMSSIRDHVPALDRSLQVLHEAGSGSTRWNDPYEVTLTKSISCGIGMARIRSATKKMQPFRTPDQKRRPFGVVPRDLLSQLADAARGYRPFRSGLPWVRHLSEDESGRHSITPRGPGCQTGWLPPVLAKVRFANCR